ncbi:Uncharacterized protein APZ42_003339 [Daphnia magna]|uniref:Uncharacterized protein n=1 Tax=Daphnia magna TaxID=35525 RepID=A0A0P6A6W0_9CRUS|nr:Uncharacterized protein APZ42_003339 [Daphnia magna]
MKRRNLSVKWNSLRYSPCKAVEKVILLNPKHKNKENYVRRFHISQ